MNWDHGYVSFQVRRGGRPLLLRTLPREDGREARRAPRGADAALPPRAARRARLRRGRPALGGGRPGDEASEALGARARGRRRAWCGRGRRSATPRTARRPRRWRAPRPACCGGWREGAAQPRAPAVPQRAAAHAAARPRRRSRSRVATARHAAVAWELLPGPRARRRARGRGRSRPRRSGCARSPRGCASSRRRPTTLAEWAAVKALVDRRAFSWTGLFAALEQALPPGVRLVSIQPVGRRPATELTLAGGQGRSSEDALALLQSLQAHGDFEGAFLNGWTEGREGVDISCSVRYVPRAGGEAVSAAASGARGCCRRSWCCWPSTWACSLAWTLPRSLRQKNAAARAVAARAELARERERAPGAAASGPRRSARTAPTSSASTRRSPAARSRTCCPRSRRSRSWPRAPGLQPASRTLRREERRRRRRSSAWRSRCRSRAPTRSSWASCAGSSARSAS